jgi:serine-type D-Ala-D-Ala carboxypeptidase/endopeptidase (penicillin-binding protein 4)
VKSASICRLCPLLIIAVCFVAAAQTNTADPGAKAPASTAELRQRLIELIEQPRFASALWGLKIDSLDTGETLFEYNAEKLFVPASNSKLYTVALALTRLGPEYHIRTSVYSSSRPDASGTLKGDLVIYGRGDPCINSRLNGGDVLKAVQPLISALTNAGVRRVSGVLVGDYSYFRGSEYGSGWMCDDPQYYYGAEVSALTINDNVLQARVQPGDAIGSSCRISLTPATDYVSISNRAVTVAEGGKRNVTVFRPLGGNLVYVSGQVPLNDPGAIEDVTVHDPAGLFVALFGEALARNGVEFQGKLRTVGWLERQTAPLRCTDLVELASMESLPLSRLAREVQKPSQNLYADLLLSHVGETTRNEKSNSPRTSEELGIAALNQFVAEAGIPGGNVIFEEGSGLSRDNLTTPNATVALLRFMEKSPAGPAYLAALPIAGVDGTLRNRMKGTPAAGNVRAKTGTLRWAHSLSGHVTTTAGERLVFCAMLNRYWNNEGQSARADLDAIAALLAGFQGKSR